MVIRYYIIIGFKLENKNLIFKFDIDIINIKRGLMWYVKKMNKYLLKIY